jgi:hypothetical protein
MFGSGTATFPLRLMIASQRDAAVSGTLTLSGPPLALTDEAFTGTVDPTGVVSFEISKDVVVCGVTPATARLSNWHSQITTGGTMMGSFTWTVPLGPVFCVGDTSRTFPLTTENQLQPLSR